MAKQTPEDALAAIEAIIRHHGQAVAASEICRALPTPIPPRTLQYRLNRLIAANRLIREGTGRWARYRLPDAALAEAPQGDDGDNDGSDDGDDDGDLPIALSAAAGSVRDYVRQRPEARKPVGYNREFLNGYRPNVTSYLTEAERAWLSSLGRPQSAEQPAGTYAKHILNRLLIDLAWNSSRLEGNTYSLLDTRRLIEFGHEAEGRAHLEAQMILNHKDAIEFLVSAADDIGFNRYTILNLHAMLAGNLLADPSAAGRLRYIAVGIERSAFHPLEMPQLIEEAFDQILATADAIADPFEQAFFVMVQLPYLQAFDDVNKRVSRLAANIPLIKRNLSPLSFADVPRRAYTEAMLGVYELNRIDLLKELFLWAYERSAARYAAVRQSLGEPDPFRLRYRDQLRDLVGQLVRNRTGRNQATACIAAWTTDHIAPVDRDRFIETAEAELTGLHEGNFARYRIRPSEFEAWRRVWDVG